MFNEDCKFYVKGVGWDTLVSTNSKSEAATLGFEQAYAELGKEIKISPNILVVDLCGVVDEECEKAIEYLDTTKVLANAGLHQLSKRFKNIIDSSNE